LLSTSPLPLLVGRPSAATALLTPPRLKLCAIILVRPSIAVERCSHPRDKPTIDAPPSSSRVIRLFHRQGSPHRRSPPAMVQSRRHLHELYLNTTLLYDSQANASEHLSGLAPPIPLRPSARCGEPIPGKSPTPPTPRTYSPSRH
jgi:hypothetical protein